MKIAFVHSDYGANAGEDGGTIFDRRLMDSLKSFTSVDLLPVPILRRRDSGFPIWRSKINATDRTRLAELHAEGARIVISHEALFSSIDALPGTSKADLLIVHNFMPRFQFQGRPFLSSLYRAGSLRFIRRSLDRTLSILWLSNADFQFAKNATEGDWHSRSIILAPPPRHQEIGPRDPQLIHIDGTTAWRAKSLSRLTLGDHAQIKARGYSIGDFGTSPRRAFGLITDRFSVGFKLKLMQMIYSRDIIASLTDLESDVRQVLPEYPCYRTVGSVSEALDYFDSFQGGIPEMELENAVVGLESYTWNRFGAEVISALRMSC